MSAPLRIREAIVVEGRYDKAALAGVVDTRSEERRVGKECL